MPKLLQNFIDGTLWRIKIEKTLFQYKWWHSCYVLAHYHHNVLWDLHCCFVFVFIWNGEMLYYLISDSYPRVWIILAGDNFCYPQQRTFLPGFLKHDSIDILDWIIVDTCMIIKKVSGHWQTSSGGRRQSHSGTD